MTDIKLATDTVYKKGLNVYALLNRFKKVSKLRVEIPEEVIIGVCNQYLVQEGRILNQWPWFLKVLESESRKYFARQNQLEGERFKKEPTGLKHIFARLIQESV